MRKRGVFLYITETTAMWLPVAEFERRERKAKLMARYLASQYEQIRRELPEIKIEPEEHEDEKA
jgi:hypothetical protein